MRQGSGPSWQSPGTREHIESCTDTGVWVGGNWSSQGTRSPGFVLRCCPPPPNPPALWHTHRPFEKLAGISMGVPSLLCSIVRVKEMRPINVSGPGGKGLQRKKTRYASGRGTGEEVGGLHCLLLQLVVVPI